MSKGTINKAILIGRMGKDVDMKYTSSGVPIANFSVATNETWRDEQGNEKSVTDWHNIVAWRKLAEICAQYLKKGSQVYVEGKLRTRSWEKDGVKHYMTEIIAESIQMIGDKKEEAAPPLERTVDVPNLN